jgi:hypothetical protein
VGEAVAVAVTVAAVLVPSADACGVVLSLSLARTKLMGTAMTTSDATSGVSARTARKRVLRVPSGRDGC